MKITGDQLHPHLLARMRQRGITLDEIELTLNEGWEASDAKVGVVGKVKVFEYAAEWEGRFYPEKEVTVYYKIVGDREILLTAKARYGQSFPRR